MTADVRIDHVTKRFDGGVVAVDDLTLEVESGKFYAFLGPSGCGKTTTLRMIGGFEEPTDGTIYLGDQPVTNLPPYKRDVNTVFQSYALFPHLTIQENVAFGLRRKGVKGDELQELRRLSAPRHLVDALHLEREGDVVDAGEVRKERIALEHHRCAAPGRRQVGDVVIADQDVAVSRAFVAGDHAQRRSLAAP